MSNVFGTSILVPSDSTVGFGLDTATAVKITTGAGAPVHTPAQGSLYIRTDGAVATTLYVYVGGAWKAFTAA